jgi:hypothetical protein
VNDAKASPTANEGSIVYGDDYLVAAAILFDREPLQYRGLLSKLKGRGYHDRDFERKVRETHFVRKREERQVQQQQAKQQVRAQSLQRAGGQPLDLEVTQPADLQVDGATLAQDLADTVRRFVVLSKEAIHAIVLWILFTYLIDIFDFAPRLAISSPEFRCGKTTLVDLLANLTCRSLSCSNISPAAVYWTIDAVKPTLLLDEMDAAFSLGPATEELRGVLNSGHARSGAYIVRLLPVGQGVFEPRRFSTFTPIVHALIGKLPSTLADRAIPIAMQRKLPQEKVEPLVGKNKKVNQLAFEALRRRIARWTTDHRDAIAQIVPTIPESLNDREKNNWGVLLAIAEEIGQGWEILARDAARLLSETDNDNAGLGVQLLHDLKTILEDAKEMWSEQICRKLHQMEGRPWSQFGRTKKPISKYQLAHLLKPFKVYPVQIYIRGCNKNGYRLTDLAEAVSRYCSDSPDSKL